MKKFLGIAGVLIFIVAMSAFSGCCKNPEPCPEPGPQPITNIEPPASLSISADNTGSRVILTWEPSPTEDIDGYIIYFKPLNGSFSPIDTVEATETWCEVNPNGVSGDYHVTAYKCENESDPTEDVSTIPYHTASTILYELNASGDNGYGWDRISGQGNTYPMSQATSAEFVDFYLTNFAAGYAFLPYYLASPDVSQQAHDSTIVPSASWKVNGILTVTNEQANSILPAAGNYVTYEELTGNTYYGVHTQDNYYGVIYTNGMPNTQNGTQSIETWFQLVNGLRLVNHR
jgi:hypothetical protein